MDLQEDLFPRPPSDRLQFDTAAYAIWARKDPEAHDRYVKSIWSVIEQYEATMEKWGTIRDILEKHEQTENLLDRTEMACAKREKELLENEEAFQKVTARGQVELEEAKKAWEEEQGLQDKELVDRRQAIMRDEKALADKTKDLAEQEDAIQNQRKTLQAETRVFRQACEGLQAAIKNLPL